MVRRSDIKMGMEQQTPMTTSMTPSSSSRFVSRARFSRYIALAAVLGSATVLSTVAAHADTTRQGSAVTVLPGGKKVTTGLRVAVVAATSTTGDADDAQRALAAAQAALATTRSYAPVAQKDVAAALNSLSTAHPKKADGAVDTRDVQDRNGLTSAGDAYGEPAAGDARIPLDALDFRNLGKRLKTQRALAVYVTPTATSESSASYNALVELYDVNTGGIVGRGEGSFTTNVNAEATASDAPVVDGTARADVAAVDGLTTRALGGAVYRAVQNLNRPIELRGSVLSIPGPYQARVSLSEYKGARNGARIEFLENGSPVAYGTLVSVGVSEALATVAPESSFSNVYVNMQVRNVNNPALGRQGKTDTELQDAEYARFEREFARSLIGVLAVYEAFAIAND